MSATGARADCLAFESSTARHSNRTGCLSICVRAAVARGGRTAVLFVLLEQALSVVGGVNIFRYYNLLRRAILTESIREASNRRLRREYEIDESYFGAEQKSSLPLGASKKSENPRVLLRKTR